MMLLAGCASPENEMTTPSTPIPWSSLAQRRVVFAHQSVGSNILSGVEALARKDGASLAVVEQRSRPASPGITHFNVGRNEDPLGKIQDFVSAVESGATEGADVALVKLCYIDFSADTDASEVGKAYISSLDALAAKYPETAFVAVTAPLAAVQTGPKAWIKTLLGRQPAQYVENAKRAEFNDMLRAHYQRDGRLFDLARAESAARGVPAVVRVGGREVEALDPALTSDGGHLNARGEELVAREFLVFLGSLPDR
jgi:hypothetical protein